MGKSLYCGCHEKNGRGGVSRLGLASSNNFNRLGNIWAVPRGLLPGPGMIGTDIGTECKSLMQR